MFTENDMDLFSEIGTINNIVVNGQQGTIFINNPDTLFLKQGIHLMAMRPDNDYKNSIKQKITLEMIGNNIDVYKNKR